MLGLSITALRGMQCVCGICLSPYVCIYICICVRACVSKSCCWLQAQFPSFALFKSHPLVAPVSWGHWLLYKMQSPSQAQGMNLSAGKLLCKCVKATENTMARWAGAESEVNGSQCEMEGVNNWTWTQYHRDHGRPQTLCEASDKCWFSFWGAMCVIVLDLIICCKMYLMKLNSSIRKTTHSLSLSAHSSTHTGKQTSFYHVFNQPITSLLSNFKPIVLCATAETLQPSSTQLPHHISNAQVELISGPRLAHREHWEDSRCKLICL